MSVTMTANLIIPEVVSGLIDSNLGDGITLLPLAEQDDTLVGQPGDTLKFPVFSYIGKAAVVAENGQIIPGRLTASMKSVTVHKYAKAISISDEARLSGYGDPVGEGSRQLAHSLDHAVDDDLFQCLNDAGKVVAITQFTGLECLTARAAQAGFKLEAAEGGKTRVVIPADWSAPLGYHWGYKANSAAVEEGAFGTAYTADGTCEDGALIELGTKTHVHLLLLDGDSKPVKTLTLVK